jgi:two-component system NtrC family sensor kinase
VVLTVSDTGAGILPEHRDRIFDAFFTTKKAVAGVGLGLSVTHGIIQQHHGTIAVESAVGAGTTFTITLPVPIVEAHRA